MKKILLGLILSMVALQVSAVTLNWEQLATGSSFVVDNASTISSSSQGYSAGDTVMDVWQFKSSDATPAVSISQVFTPGDITDFSVSITDGFSVWDAVFDGSSLYEIGLNLVAGTVYTMTISGEVNTDGVHYSTRVSSVPLPAAAWLMGSALVGLVSFGRRKTELAA